MLSKLGQSSQKIYENFWLRNLIFILLSVIYIFPMVIHKSVYSFNQDALFHLNRVYEIKEGIEVGKFFPDVSAFTFGSSGYGVNFFYPISFIYIIAIIWCIVGKGITAYYISVFIFLLFSQNILYNTGKNFFKNTKKAILFSILFTFSIHNMGVLFNAGNMAITFASLFIPVTFFGLYDIFYRKGEFWYYLPIGASLILLNSLAVTFMMVLSSIIFVILSIYFRKITYNSFCKLIVSTIFVTMLSSYFLVPFLIQKKSLGENLSGPFLTNIQKFTANIGSSVQLNISNTYGSYASLTIGIALLILLLYFSIIILNNLNNKNFNNSKIYLIIFVIYFILQSNLFPWHLFQNSFLNIIQYPGRFSVFANVFLIIFIVEFLIECNLPKEHKVISVVFILFSLFFASSQYSSNLIGVNNEQYNSTIKTNPLFLTNDTLVEKLINNKNGISDYRDKKQLVYNYKDDPSLIKQNLVDVLNNKIILIDNKEIDVKLTHDNYTFIASNLPTGNHEVQLPMTWYKGFEATDEKGNTLPLSKNDKGYVMVESENQSQIRVTYVKSLIEKMSIVISVISWVLLTIYIVFRAIKSHKIFIK
ncbi:hypothetical protein BG262_07920 [Floricoccus penangensis]|uniref:Membrane protein 6-pyruvoyl-tetrahydropterin synthase-related domain-containing protein n=2 Tax=Floricoccus penangensis TaxID=1859475 RepID=A0A9Q5P1E6_9LACT|nr:hypothetical protein BG262_07920 [Floricoccus penangensis]